MKKHPALLVALIVCSLMTNAQNTIKLVQFSAGYSKPIGNEIAVTTGYSL